MNINAEETRSGIEAYNSEIEITEFKDLWMTSGEDVEVDIAIIALENIIEEKRMRTILWIKPEHLT